MNPSQANSRKCLQQSIDTEIKSLEESLQALKYRRNALSPVSSLHPELFAAIFSILCLPGTSSQDGKPDHHISQLRVSHVCHQWREIALNLPLLWSHVNFTSESLSSVGIAEILFRAKSTPLYLEANFLGHRQDRDRCRTLRKELHTHIPHMRQLRISAEPVLLKAILKELASPSPTLEHLTLSSASKGNQRRGTPGRSPWRSQPSIPDTLFESFTPRLSRLELCECNISWRSSLLKGLKYLEILNPSTNARPELAVWLAALDEMPQLTTLTLHSASPIAPPFPFVVRHTVTLSSLTRLDISGSPGDCALALAHLDLPALTWLCLIAFPYRQSDVKNLLPFIMRHAHGPQDAQPLQSVLIRSDELRTDILAWPVPNIGVEVHDLPTLLTTTPHTRVALSFRTNEWFNPDSRLEILDMAMAGLPLDGLVTLAASDLSCMGQRSSETLHFWYHFSPKWPLLQCVRLAPDLTSGFIAMLLEDSGRRKRPLLPSLKLLVIVDFSLRLLSFLPLYDALRKRVEQGVPVKMLDLRMCRSYPDSHAHNEDWLQLLSKTVGNILRPEQTSEAREQMELMWNTVTRGPFIGDDDSSEHYDSVLGTDSSDDDEGSEE